ncbi:MAG: DUF4360 domain-containing protein, partial [Proteobacteria bacterium]|nr:DUF4360 domain-containing protein [Pseudomonadota bacterium]
ILLSKDRWVSHFEQDRDVYFLVFHEMLRAIGINDDNYIISGAINPFPSTRKILTRIGTVFPILGEVSLDKIIPIERIVLEGNGCPRQLGGTFADVDLEKNILNVGLQKFDINLVAITAGRKACNVVIPVNPPIGTRVVVTQMDFSAKAVLHAGTKASISSRASFASTSIAPKSKSIEATESIQGRLLIRSHQSVSSGCSGQSEILRISTAGTLQKPINGQEDLNQLIADQILVSFALEACGK